MNKTLKIVLFSFLAVLLLVIVFYIVRAVSFFSVILSLNDRAGKDNVINYVNANSSELEARISGFLSGDTADEDNIEDIVIFPETKIIKGVSHQKTDLSPYYTSPDDRIIFDCGGYGMGSATGYEGFLYLVSDVQIETDPQTGAANMAPLGFHGPYRADKQDWFLPDGDGWRWKEENGDNTVYVEHIVGKFYYFLAEY